MVVFQRLVPALGATTVVCTFPFTAPFAPEQLVVTTAMEANEVFYSHCGGWVAVEVNYCRFNFPVFPFQNW